MVPQQSGRRCLLFDNGSLRPESTLNLRLIPVLYGRYREARDRAPF
jgi:hypothetical protein